MRTPSPSLRRSLLPLALAALLTPSLAPSLAQARSFRGASGGVPLVFDRADLPEGDWYEIARPVAADQRAHVEQLLAAEAAKYPPGFLPAVGLSAFGVFSGLASPHNDGFHTYDKALGGYRYFGLYNGRDAVMAAWYSDEQVALTFHHEVFHHIDSVEGGRHSGAAFSRDDARFSRAASGQEPYEALRLPADLLARLRAAAGDERLRRAVSAYAAKNVGEDQAETARWFMTHLAEGLLQAAEAPALPGSQRILHLLATYTEALPSAAQRVGSWPVWLAHVALGDEVAQQAPPARLAAQSVEEHLRPGGHFVVRGREGPDGVNHRLQADLRAVPGLVVGAPDPRQAARDALTLLQGYQRYIEARWTLSASTRGVLDEVRSQLQGLLGRRAAPAGSPAPARNPYSARVEEAIADPKLRAVILAVQPAAVRLTRGNSGGSGVVISPAGLVLTAGHVAPRVDQELGALLPDGARYTATTLAVDKRLDLALLQLDLPRGHRLVSAVLAPAPPQLRDRVVTIGQPGSTTPDGEPTGYQPFHVSVGHIRKFAKDRLGAQALGGTGHDAWTYWGHSGAPLFNDRGEIVALHNSWDSTTAMRHAVTWEAISDFLAREAPNGSW